MERKLKGLKLEPNVAGSKKRVSTKPELGRSLK